jgi:hypothetical protein
MTAVLLTAAFALTPPPKPFVFEKPPDEVELHPELVVLRDGPSRQDRERSASLTAAFSVPPVARCGPIISLAVERSEGGFSSGFGPAPPWALPRTGGAFWPPSGWTGEPPSYDPGRSGTRVIGGKGFTKPGDRR